MSALPDLAALAPELILAGTASSLLFWSFWWPRRESRVLWWSALGFTLALLGVLWWCGQAWILGGHTGRPGNPLLPEMCGVAATLGVFLWADAVSSGVRPFERSIPTWIALVGIGLATWRAVANARGFDGGILTPIFSIGVEGEDQVLRKDAFSSCLRVLLLAAAGAMTLWSAAMERRSEAPVKLAAKYWASYLVSLMACSLLVMTENVIVIWAATETAAMAAILQIGARGKLACEATSKAFTIGGLGTASMFVGVAFLYGFGGGFSLDAIGIGFEDLEPEAGDRLFAGFAWVCFFVGVLVKTAVVPLHFASTEAVEVSPCATKSVFTVLLKVAGVAVILRAMMAMSGASGWTPGFAGLFAILAGVTMTVGNLAALRESNLDRLVAALSVAWTGTILVGVAAFYSFESDENEDGVAEVVASYASDEAVVAVLLALLAYSMALCGVHAALHFFRECLEGAGVRDVRSVESLRGCGSTFPWVTSALVIFAASIVGLPPTVGFFAKLELCRVALARPDLVWLVFLLVINTILTLACLVPILVCLLSAPGSRGFDVRLDREPRHYLGLAVLFVLALLTVGLVLVPSGVVDLARAAALGLRL